MAVILIHKKSSVQNRTPDSSDLEYGELAVNYADGYIYYKAANNSILDFLTPLVFEALINSKILCSEYPGARAAISVTDNGGDGSLGYNHTTGVITYQGPVRADVACSLI